MSLNDEADCQLVYSCSACREHPHSNVKFNWEGGCWGMGDSSHFINIYMLTLASQTLTLKRGHYL